ncbi:MAG TPA: hypothetical protein VGM20_08835 [Gemmatimonadales bacterium]|jgi:hypothetical protein
MTPDHFVLMAIVLVPLWLIAVLAVHTIAAARGRPIGRAVKILGVVAGSALMVALIWGLLSSLPGGFRWTRSRTLIVVAPVAGLFLQGGIWLYASLRSGELQQSLRERRAARRLKRSSREKP